MKNSLTYLGYAARVEFSAEDECFAGHIAGIQDTLGFHGESVSKLTAAELSGQSINQWASEALNREASV